MSLKNRKKFFEGLAKARALGFSSFRRLYPSAVSVKATADGDCTLIINSARYDVENGKTLFIKERIPAGTEIRVEKKQSTVITTTRVYKPLSVSCVFSFPEQSITVSGGDSSDKQGQIRFLVPLPRPWDYAKPIKDAFGLDTSTRGVSAYPDCR